MTGLLLILSGPAGSGKSTLVDLLRRTTRDLPIHVSVSATTRPRREYEQEGLHYHFWTPEQFAAELAAGGFLEHAEVHGRYSYGTLARDVLPHLAEGRVVILVIDVQGADQIRQRIPEAITVFLKAPSLEDYRNRLEQRGSDTQEAIDRRLVTAERELPRAADYNYVVVNDTVDHAVEQLRAIIRNHYPRDTHAG
jgi:guanylate kinase